MRFAARAAARRALPRLLLPLSATYSRLRPGIRILMYHRVDRLAAYDQLTVTPERFEEQVAYLSRHCRVISLDQAMSELDSRAALRPGVVVTFDDGYRDNLVYALPVLATYRVPATVFVTTRFCDGSLSHPRYSRTQDRLHLDWSEVREMARTPGITIGSHTLSHPYLSRLSDAQAHAEIVDSRGEIAARCGIAPDFFCYPSGDFGAREMEAVRSAGYRGAVSVAPGANRGDVGRYALRRTEVTDRDGVPELRAKLAGAYDAIHALLHRRRIGEFRRAAHEAGRRGS